MPLIFGCHEGNLVAFYRACDWLRLKNYHFSTLDGAAFLFTMISDIWSAFNPARCFDRSSFCQQELELETGAGKRIYSSSSRFLSRVLAHIQASSCGFPVLLEDTGRGCLAPMYFNLKFSRYRGV